MRINKNIFIVLIITSMIFWLSCYDDFKGPAGYSNYYFDNQTEKELFLEYKLSERKDGEVKKTSILYPDSMVRFHNDRMTEENPTPEKSFQWIKIYERKNDTTDVIIEELNPMIDTAWTSEKITDFDIGEKNWYLKFPLN